MRAAVSMRVAVSTTSLNALAEQGAVVGGGLGGAGHELVQPDPFDELRPRVDQGDVHVVARIRRWLAASVPE